MAVSILNTSTDAGYRVGRVRVIFSIPKRELPTLFSPDKLQSLPEHLAYVEWFTPFRQPEPSHGMYKIAPSIRNNVCEASIVPLSDLRRSIHLLPRYGAQAPRAWTSATVLDECCSFFANSFGDRHMYGILF